MAKHLPDPTNVSVGPQSPRSNDGWPPISYWVKVTIAVAVTIGILVVVKSISSIIVLLVIALVIAVGLEPAMHFLMTRAKVKRRGVAVAILFFVGVFVVGGFLALVVPALVHEINSLAADLPKLVPKLEQRNDWIGRQISAHQDQIRSFISNLPSRLAGSFTTILSVTGKIGGIVFNALTVVVLSIFFMAALPRMRDSAIAHVIPRRRSQAQRMIDDSIRKIGGYVAGNLATSAICAVCSSIALAIIGVPFSVVLGIWAGIADLIPAIGAYIGLIPAVAVALSQGVIEGVIVLTYFTAYQQLENYYIVPRVMQDAVDMSSVSVLIATLIGASLGGFAGALLAIPVAATLKVVLTDLWQSSSNVEGMYLSDGRDIPGNVESKAD